jgi:hypothetical protein
MTRIIGAVLLVAVVALGLWNQVLELRNAELASALAITQRRAVSASSACGDLIAVARYGDYAATLQMATRTFEQFRPRDTNGARTDE